MQMGAAAAFTRRGSNRMTCGVFFQKICVFFPWVGLGSDDKHKDIVVSDSEGLHLTSIGFRFQVFF